MSAQGHSIRIAQLKIYAEEEGEGSPALVFMHCWGGSRRTRSEVIAWLRNRFRCVAVDLRGWGKSDRPADDYSFFAQADDVQGVIESLNLKDFVLVGHSMGGKIAQILAGRRPAACARLFSSPPRRRHPFTPQTRKSRCSPAIQHPRASGTPSKSSTIGL